MKKLLLATTNEGKRKELFTLLGEEYEILLPKDVGINIDVEETGTTFVENATLKAVAYGKASGLMTMADDSGLEIDAMGGEPGIYSARFGGPNATYQDKFNIIQKRLKDVPFEKRTARFRCAVVLYIDENNIHTFEGKCEGLIAYDLKGTNGFGYDPIFYVPQFDKHMAELDPSVKNQISHRGNAVRQLVDFLKTI